MWTVFLVEDEAFVRETVRELVDWASLGFRVIGEAGNGEEALEAIRALKPDVVIADIVMHGLDGIELLRKTRESGINSRFIMLTAMNDFDYAREALQYGAFNYLLKLSLNDDILLDNMGRIKKELVAELNGRTATLQPWYRQVWADIWGRGPWAGGNEVRSAPQTGDLQRFQLAVVSVISGAEPASVGKVLAQPNEWDTIQTFHEWGITTLFCWRTGSIPQQITQAGSGTAMAVIPAGNLLSSLESAWRGILTGLSPSWYGEGPEPDGEGELADTARAPKELEAELLRCFEEGQAPRSLSALQALWRACRRSGSSLVEVKLMASRLIQAFAILAGEQADYSCVAEAASHEALLRSMLRHTSNLLGSQASREVQETDHPEVNQLIRYMQQHYREQIRVADLARLVSMNVDYLSTIFGRKTGMTPVAYLNHIRIEQAKQLLLGTRLSIGEVADQAGFTDHAYFIRVFKRAAGETPNAFRRTGGR